MSRIIDRERIDGSWKKDLINCALVFRYEYRVSNNCLSHHAWESKHRSFQRLMFGKYYA